MDKKYIPLSSLLHNNSWATKIIVYNSNKQGKKKLKIESWNSMHNNENPCCLWSFKYDNFMINFFATFYLLTLQIDKVNLSYIWFCLEPEDKNVSPRPSCFWCTYLNMSIFISILHWCETNDVNLHYFAHSTRIFNLTTP